MAEAREVIGLHLLGKVKPGKYIVRSEPYFYKADEIIAALAAAGWKVVGREPTMAMRDAPVGVTFVGDPYRHIWQLMFDAAPPTKERERERESMSSLRTGLSILAALASLKPIREEYPQQRAPAGYERPKASISPHIGKKQIAKALRRAAKQSTPR